MTPLRGVLDKEFAKACMDRHDVHGFIMDASSGIQLISSAYLFCFVTFYFVMVP